MSSDSMVLMDAAGRRRSPATTPGYLAGRAPRNKGMQYPPDPPRPEEIIVVMRQAGHDRHGLRLRALIAVLWRAGLRISEALALNETDVDVARGSLLIRHGKGDLCRIRHRPPYVAPETMLRWRALVAGAGWDRGLSAEHSSGWVRDSPGMRAGRQAAGSDRVCCWSGRCDRVRGV
jgi:integrase